jgi:hypothetical protein
MSMANGSHGDLSGKHRASNRKSAPHKGMQPDGDETTEVDTGATFFAITVDAKTAQVVKFESFDASGARHELSDDEKKVLTRKGSHDDLRALVEQAFEAGIACVLGDEGRSSAKESESDAELRHLLLTPLIKRSLAKRLLEGEVLNRALLGTLIQHSMKSDSAPGNAGSVQ